MRVVKGYTKKQLEDYAKQRVIEELEARLDIAGNDCPFYICSKIQDRIKELKEEL